MTEAGRYFPGDEPALRERLDRYLDGLGERLAHAPFSNAVTCLLLAGGYGRGEGGVFRAAQGAAPELYNDLEFYLVLRNAGSRGEAEQWCAIEAHNGEGELGIEVEFKVLPMFALQCAEPSMFYYDLLVSHRVIWGDAGIVSRLPSALLDATQIPAHEATRLLFNRGTGLYFCSRMLAGAEPPDSDFIERNHAKVKLALGDAALAVNQLYHFSCRVRNVRLNEAMGQLPPASKRIVRWHQVAVDFKFAPRHESPLVETLRVQQQQLIEAWLAVFLWVERLRLHRAFETGADYVGCRERLFPEFPKRRNWILHARDRLRRGGALPQWSDYPRAALQRALVSLLTSTSSNAAGPLLGLPKDASEAQIYDTYRRWWKFYN